MFFVFILSISGVSSCVHHPRCDKLELHTSFYISVTENTCTCSSNKYHTILKLSLSRSQKIKIKCLTFTTSKVLVLTKIVLLNTQLSRTRVS